MSKWLIIFVVLAIVPVVYALLIFKPANCVQKINLLNDQLLSLKEINSQDFKKGQELSSNKDLRSFSKFSERKSFDVVLESQSKMLVPSGIRGFGFSLDVSFDVGNDSKPLIALDQEVNGRNPGILVLLREYTIKGLAKPDFLPDSTWRKMVREASPERKSPTGYALLLLSQPVEIYSRIKIGVDPVNIFYCTDPGQNFWEVDGGKTFLLSTSSTIQKPLTIQNISSRPIKMAIVTNNCIQSLENLQKDFAICNK